MRSEKPRPYKSIVRVFVRRSSQNDFRIIRYYVQVKPRGGIWHASAAAALPKNTTCVMHTRKIEKYRIRRVYIYRATDVPVVYNRTSHTRKPTGRRWTGGGGEGYVSFLRVFFWFLRPQYSNNHFRTAPLIYKRYIYYHYRYYDNSEKLAALKPAR